MVDGHRDLGLAGQVAVGDNDTAFLEEFTRFPMWEDHLLACWSYQPQISQMPLAENMDELNRHAESAYRRSLGEAYG